MITMLIIANHAAADESSNISQVHVKGIIGAITDNSSRIGKEQIVAMKMALQDFYHRRNQTFVLHLRNSKGDPLQAAHAAKDLIDKDKVQAIIGPQTWDETALVAEICSQKNTPLLSLADATPEWGTDKWHFLVQGSPAQFMQMKAIAAIVQSWEWRQVTVIYEDRDSSSTGVLAHLTKALSQTGIEISDLLAIPPFVSSSLSHKLNSLREGQCRVFIVHMSFPLALHFFEMAKRMNMMEKGYVWITTDTFSSFVHSLNASTISSMEGIIGVKSYFPKIGTQYEDFYHRFRQNFNLENPQEFNHEPGIFAARAYDVAWTTALAMTETNKGGQVLLDKIFQSNFTGLSGKFCFIDNKLAPEKFFQIINLMGKSYGELGFWTNGLNFSLSIGPNASYNRSMKELGQVIWPGRPWHTPRGWTIPTRDKPLRIGVPSLSAWKQLVQIIQDQSENTTFQGFAIELFRETVDLLPYHLPYQFYPFNESYDDLVKQIYLKNFEAVVGDVTIVAERYQYVEFSQPYTDPGVVMVVPLQSKAGNRTWLFLKPFTKTMWVLIGAMVVYNGFVLWLMEKNHCPELKGSLLNQSGTMMWLAFTTLISLHGDKLHSNLSRMTMVMWLFVALIITQSYTANLASMLTVERLEPTINDVEQLRNSNAMVGYSRGSFLQTYLQKVLHFHPANLKYLNSSEEYAEALRRKEIAAFFLEVAVSKIFLAKYCKEFTQAGPMYKVGGLGFAFPKGSPLLPSVNRALLEVFESGKLREIENKMLAAEKCEEAATDGESTSLSPQSFWALFILTGGTSTFALLIYIIRMSDSDHGKRTMWRLMMVMIQQWGAHKRRFSRRVSDVVEHDHLNSPNTSAFPTQV
ncbi:hypothetical protein L6164_018392 [Bauhinia variegata]|uniref:Uncharacterized protein n=1 Tax=Bauhinia variegata TaxID=167791 RepID=A0ACB9NB53_BAUVA|nr:hypothetical protein L6164_018392 [Bauhinia variegata]